MFGEGQILYISLSKHFFTAVKWACCLKLICLSIIIISNTFYKMKLKYNLCHFVEVGWNTVFASSAVFAILDSTYTDTSVHIEVSLDSSPKFCTVLLSFHPSTPVETNDSSPSIWFCWRFFFSLLGGVFTFSLSPAVAQCVICCCCFYIL